MVQVTKRPVLWKILRKGESLSSLRLHSFSGRQKQLAQVLARNQDIKIMIEGHTDDVPFRKGSSIKDNWDLSVMRATSIVRILLDGSGIDPVRLTVAGRGEYLPVDPADPGQHQLQHA